MQTVIIKRSKWLRGTNGIGSYLEHPTNGKKCCIGFLCATLFPGAKRQGVTTLDRLYSDKASTFSHKYGSTLYEAYRVNDSRYYPPKSREKKLKAIGLEMGIKFKFIP